MILIVLILIALFCLVAGISLSIPSLVAQAGNRDVWEVTGWDQCSTAFSVDGDKYAEFNVYFHSPSPRNYFISNESSCSQNVGYIRAKMEGETS